jgi:hypothetical protein
MEENSGEDVFGCIDGHWGLEKALIAFERAVDGDVF